MKEVYVSTKARKDLKKYRSNKRFMQELYDVLGLLCNDKSLPSRYKVHKLIGQYKGCLECHIENNTLLIWIDRTDNVIEVVRIGSHSELFK